MTLTDPQDLPSLDDTFRGSSHVLRPLHRAGVTTVTPIMMLSVEQLRYAIYGIGKKTALDIAQALSDKHLPHRRFGDHGYDFVDEAFGSVNNTPIGALHVKTSPSDFTSYSHYLPLKLIAMLESLNAHMTLGELMTHSVEQLTDLMRQKTSSEGLVIIMQREIPDINRRLLDLRADKIIISDDGVALNQGQRRLHVV